MRGAAASTLLATMLLAASVALAACGGESKSVAVGWETHHVDDGGFSIETPAAWRTAKELDRDSLDEFIDANPEFASFREALTSGLIKFIARDPDASDNFATNVNVTVHALGASMKLEEYARESAALVRRFNAEQISVSFARLPAGRCARLSYEYQVQLADGLKWLAVLQYGWVHGASEYVVTFTTLPALRKRYRTTFLRSARSFRFD